MFKRLSNYIKNKGLCFSMQSKNKRVTISICSDLDAARIETPYTNKLVEMDNIIPALSEAYTAARRESDSEVMEEIHSVRQVIQKAYA
jgi:hypothetical protein